MDYRILYCKVLFFPLPVALLMTQMASTRIYKVLFSVILCYAGVAQGVITGIRGLCNGLGPALFGFIFFLFHVDLNVDAPESSIGGSTNHSNTYHMIQTAIRVSRTVNKDILYKIISL